MTNRPSSRDELNPLLQYLYDTRAVDLRGYKSQTLGRRVHRRMQAVGVQTVDDYVDYLQTESAEFLQLIDTLLINVTGFYRDPEAWTALKENGLPVALGEKEPDEPIRVWVAGCSTGEEAYTIAMLLAEYLGWGRFKTYVKIFATDIDDQALDLARQSLYSEEAVKAIPSAQLKRYFIPFPNHNSTGKPGYTPKELRTQIVFGRHDLMHDAPISKLDLVICRNTLIYMNTDVQRHILNAFHYALNPNGVLFTGKTEMLLAHTQLFEVLDKARVFRKKLSAGRGPTPIPAKRSTGGGHPMSLFEQALQVAGIALIMVDRTSKLVFANERARSQFGIAVGRRTSLANLLAEDDQDELQSAVQTAVRQRKHTTIRTMVNTVDGETKSVVLDIQPLADGQNTEAAVISIIDTSEARDLRASLSDAGDELEDARGDLNSNAEALETVNDELQATNEELQSTVEELETTKEELQSANEELETMNEELQSTNTQLATMNSDQDDLIKRLHQATEYHETILASFPQAVVVIDREYRVRHWNKKAEELWGLRADEVIGQQYLNLDFGLPVAELTDVLRQTVYQGEKATISLDGHDRRGKAIGCAVTALPLLSGENAISGVIIIAEAEER